MSAGEKVIPRPDELNADLYRHIVDTGQLHVQHCTACDQYAHPPRYYCSRCFSSALEYVPVSGHGIVYSHTVSHMSAEPAWQQEVPYATAVVELDEGPRLVGSARVADPSTIRIGQRARVSAEKRTEDFAFLVVEIDEDASRAG